MVHDILDHREDVASVTVSITDRVAHVSHKSEIPPEEIVRLLNEKRLGASIQDTGGGGVGDGQGCTRREMALFTVSALQVSCFTIGALCMFVAGHCGDHKDGAHCENQYEGGLNGGEIAGTVFYALTIALSWELYYQAYQAMRSWRLNVEFLMTIAIIGSIAEGDWMSAALVGIIVMLMDNIKYQAFRFVEKRLGSMIVEAPETVSLVAGGIIDICDLEVGMEFVVRVGEAVPADGTVTSGKASVDESKITGEALPVDKATGSEVSSGSVLHSGFLHIKARSSADTSTAGRISDAVKRAKDTRSATQMIVSKFVVWYTPAVILAAIIVALAEWNVKKFLLIIVAGCPCGLLGATPLVYGTVIAVLANKHKLLVKTSDAVEGLCNIEAIGVDKTGTITEGQFELIDMKSFKGFDESVIHCWAATVETGDNHPIARSITQSFTGCLVAFTGADGMPELHDFEREGRNGVRGVVDGHNVGVGDTSFLKKEGAAFHEEARLLYKEWNKMGKVLFVTVDRQVAGMLLLDDAVRTDAPACLAKLHSLGVRTIMLTGDNHAAAMRAAAAGGITHGYSGLQPEDKSEWILKASWGLNDKEILLDGTTEQLVAAFPDKFLATEKVTSDMPAGPVPLGFIGDGLNDCVALAKATVGITIQELGAQATMDAADAVMQGDFGHLAAAVVIARRARMLVKVNIGLAVAMNVGVMIAAATVSMPLWVSVLCDNLSLLIVLLNSLWPLCWDVAVESGKVEGQESSSGGKLTYKERKEVLKAAGIRTEHTVAVDVTIMAKGEPEEQELDEAAAAAEEERRLQQARTSTVVLKPTMEFICKECSMAFARRGGLEMHMMQHTAGVDTVEYKPPPKKSGG